MKTTGPYSYKVFVDSDLLAKKFPTGDLAKDKDNIIIDVTVDYNFTHSYSPATESSPEENSFDPTNASTTVTLEIWDEKTKKWIKKYDGELTEEFSKKWFNVSAYSVEEYADNFFTPWES